MPDIHSLTKKNSINDDEDGLSKQFLSVLKELQKKPHPHQLAIGGIAGWACGYIGSKVGKWAAFTIGSSFLLLQVANYNGWIKLNQSKFSRDVEKIRRSLDKEFFGNSNDLPGQREVTQFVSENAYLLGGFAAGTLIGVGMA